VSPTSTSINTGQTVTYSVSNITTNTWYALLDNNGVSYSSSVYKTSTGTFNLTTNAFSTPGTYNLSLTANKLSGCPLALQSASVVVATPLPLTLVSFGAVYRQGTVLLSWLTSSEQNVSHFEVQRGVDGSVFAPIGTLAAVGNSQVSNKYDFTDAQPGSNKIYYRLRMVDLDGSSRYSNIAVVKTDPFTVASVSPNPFTDEINLKVSVGQAQQLRLELLDGAGRQVRMLLINGQRGMNTLSIQQLGGLSNGLYILRLRATDQEIQQKVIKTGR